MSYRDELNSPGMRVLKNEQGEWGPGLKAIVEISKVRVGSIGLQLGGRRMTHVDG